VELTEGSIGPEVVIQIHFYCIIATSGIGADDSFDLNHLFLSGRYQVFSTISTKKVSTMNLRPQQTDPEVLIFTFKNGSNLSII